MTTPTRLIQEAADQRLLWTQPRALKQEYELRAGDETLATLHWEKSWTSSLAIARTTAGSWSYKRAGFWRPRVTARPVDADHDIATFTADWHGNGTLAIEGGRAFRWTGKGFWGAKKAWQEGDDTALVTFEYQSALRTDARVTLPPAAAALPEVAQLDELYQPLPPEEMAPPSVPLAELPLLVTFGWYLMVLEAQDAAAATVAAS